MKRPPSAPAGAPATVRLVKDLGRHLRAGHPWIWRDALAPVRLPAGSVVDVVDAGGRFLARGLFDPGSPIAVRVYTLDAAQPLDGALVDRRLADAAQLRLSVIDLDTTDAYRLCNGEGDRLPGVVVDRYASTAVVRFDGAAAATLSDHVVHAVLRLGAPLGITSVYERARHGAGRVLAGDEPPEVVEVRESGLRLGVDVKRGQKTGTFLDQRDNRLAIRRFAAGIDVANLFSYTGGFSLSAALGGARRVTSVDQAPAALEAARADFTRNGVDPEQHGFERAEVFEWLAQAAAQRRRFGLMVVDPPSFAPSEKSLKGALSAYRDLFERSLSLVEPGGLLAAASCSSHVDLEAFLAALRDAGERAGVALRVLEVRGQPPDHPTTPAFKEGRYLKFVVLRVDPL